MGSTENSCAATALFAAGKHGGEVMLITPDRIAYAGLLGRPLTREFGSITVYVSFGNPFQLQLAGEGWSSAEICVVAPDTPHRIMTLDRLIGVIMIEPESVCIDRLPAFLRPDSDPACAARALERARQAFAALVSASVPVDSIRNRVDQFFFGETLPPRTLEPRMANVVNRIKRQPCDRLGAEEFALQVDLSFSRFLHLFKSEVGTTFRRFRAWKRARSFLAYVANPQMNLTDIAFETGYPDSSHFSHTIRHYWGLTPKDIIAGSRRLAVTMDGGSFISATY